MLYNNAMLMLISSRSSPNHGTNSLENPTTFCRQHTQAAKLFIARLTRQSSHNDKQRHGQAMIVLGAD